MRNLYIRYRQIVLTDRGDNKMKISKDQWSEFEAGYTTGYTDGFQMGIKMSRCSTMAELRDCMELVK